MHRKNRASLPLGRKGFVQRMRCRRIGGAVMIEPVNSPERFCRVVAEYNGTEIRKVEQIETVTISGYSLYRFAEFYFWKIYPDLQLETVRKNEDMIFRLRAVIFILLFFILLLIIQILSDGK